jgi:hypothetical protein
MAQQPGRQAREWGTERVIRKHGETGVRGNSLAIGALSIGTSRGLLGGVTSSSQRSLLIVRGRRSEKAQNKPLFSRH